MSVSLRPVTRDDVRPLIALEVAPEQKGFVAPNAVTLAQAPYETGAHVFAILDGEARVGLCAVIDFLHHAYLEPGDDPQAMFLWRLMVAQGLQGRGLGRAAMAALCDWVRAQGVDRMATSAAVDNAVAIRFYESLGFVRTGRIMDGEAELRQPPGALRRTPG